MGFNKKYISIDTLQKYIDNGCPIWKVFNSDALFFCDNESAKIYNLFLEGVEEKIGKTKVINVGKRGRIIEI